MTFINSQLPYFTYPYSVEGQYNPPQSTHQNGFFQNDATMLNTQPVFLDEHAYDQAPFQAPMEYPCYGYSLDTTFTLPAHTDISSTQFPLENTIPLLPPMYDAYGHINHFSEDITAFDSTVNSAFDFTVGSTIDPTFYPTVDPNFNFPNFNFITQQTPQYFFDNTLAYPSYSSSYYIDPSLLEPVFSKNSNAIYQETHPHSFINSITHETQYEVYEKNIPSNNIIAKIRENLISKILSNPKKYAEITKNFISKVDFLYKYNIPPQNDDFSLIYKYKEKIDTLFKKNITKQDFSEKITKFLSENNESIHGLIENYYKIEINKSKFIHFTIYILEKSMENNKKWGYFSGGKDYIDMRTISKTFCIGNNTIIKWKLKINKLHNISKQDTAKNTYSNNKGTITRSQAKKRTYANAIA